MIVLSVLVNIGPNPGCFSQSFIYKFAEYAKHVVVADEHFFGTVLRNTHFCQTHHNDNFLFLGK